MEYTTIKEASENWGIGTRIITVYCARGRIEGAVKKGNLWLIPKNAEKPFDNRRKNNSQEKENIYGKLKSAAQSEFSKIISELSNDKDIFAQIFRQMPFPATISAPDGTIIFANAAFLDFAKVQHTDNFFGKYNVFIHSDLDGWGIRDLMTRAFRGEAICAPNLKVPRQEIAERMSGSKQLLTDTLYHDINAFSIFDDDGKLLYVISVFTMSREYRGREEIVRGKEYIHNHWQEEFDIDKLAAAVYKSKYSYARLFKESLGMTPRGYYQTVKVEKIKEKLREVNLSVAQAFAECGVDYEGGFARVFKQKTGMTPSEYRAKIVGN